MSKLPGKWKDVPVKEIITGKGWRIYASSYARDKQFFYFIFFILIFIFYIYNRPHA